jgi:hypothetical protein
VCIVDETQCELTIVGEEGRKACVVTDGAHHENPRETLLIPIDEAYHAFRQPENRILTSVNKDQLKLAKVKEKLRGVYRRRDPVRTHDSRRGSSTTKPARYWDILVSELHPQCTTHAFLPSSPTIVREGFRGVLRQ